MPKSDTRLDFGPLKPWPAALPAISFDGWRLSGFSKPTTAVYELHSSEVSFIDAFVSCYPSLTLSELARLYEVLQSTPHLESFPAVAERCCGLKAGEVLLSVLEKLVKTPRLFQDWVSQRSVAPRDLAILNSFESFHLVEPILLTIVQLGLTRSQGVQALEKALELFLMQKPLSEILTAANNAESWLQSLEQNRKPLSWQRQTQAQTKWASLPWPAYVQAKWMRQGDQGQIEVKFHFSSSADFKRKLEALGLVQAALESDKTP